jgi:adenylosuccinate lyase
MSHDRYENPLTARYASPEMSALWSEQRKFSTWRRLWVALAEAERELGLPISEAQIAELKAHTDDIDFAAATAYERKATYALPLGRSFTWGRPAVMSPTTPT